MNVRTQRICVWVTPAWAWFGSVIVTPLRLTAAERTVIG
jgi:hypothetical protein